MNEYSQLKIIVGDPGVDGERGYLPFKFQLLFLTLGLDGKNGSDGESWTFGEDDQLIVLGCIKCVEGKQGAVGEPG